MITHIVAAFALLQRLPPLWQCIVHMQRLLLECWSRLTVNEQAVVDEFCKFLPEPAVIAPGVSMTVRHAPSASDRCSRDASNESEEQMILGKIRLAEELLLRVKNHERELKRELVDILSALACAAAS